MISFPMMRTGAPLEIAGQRPHDPDAHANVDTAGEYRLLGLTAALGVEDLQRHAVLLEDAGALADVGNRSIPQSALADRESERVLRKGRRARSHRCNHQYESEPPRKLGHGRFPSHS